MKDFIFFEFACILNPYTVSPVYTLEGMPMPLANMLSMHLFLLPGRREISHVYDRLQVRLVIFFNLCCFVDDRYWFMEPKLFRNVTSFNKPLFSDPGWNFREEG